MMLPNPATQPPAAADPTVAQPPAVAHEPPAVAHEPTAATAEPSTAVRPKVNWSKLKQSKEIFPGGGEGAGKTLGQMAAEARRSAANGDDGSIVKSNYSTSSRQKAGPSSIAGLVAAALLNKRAEERAAEEHAQMKTLVSRQVGRMQRRTINPRGRFAKRWDTVVLLTLLWTAALCPFEVAFLPRVMPGSPLFVINRLVDVIVVLDVALTFCTPFRQRAKQGGRWVYSTRAIASNYINSWFALDCVAMVPIDLVVMAIVGVDVDLAASGRQVPIPSKQVALLRLVKLLRLFRAGRIRDRWMSRLTIDLSIFELLKLGFATAVCAHWLACLWGVAGSTFNDNAPIDLDEWYIESYRTLSWVQKHQLTESSPLELYSVSLYVALANIFGGPCEICPGNYLEFLVQAFMMLIGNSLWAYIIGYGCGIVTTLNPAASEHRRLVGMLNFFVEERKIAKPLANRLRMYYNETSLLRYYEANTAELKATMTPELLGESALVAARFTLHRVSYFARNLDQIEPAFLAEAQLALTTAIYCPREQIASDQLSIIMRGLVAYRGRIGVQAIGEDAILTTNALRDLCAAHALTYVQLRRLSTERLRALLCEFPSVQRVVRRAASRMAVQRAILKLAEVAREARRKGKFVDVITAFVQARIGLTGGSSTRHPPAVVPRATPLELRVDALAAKVDALAAAIHAGMTPAMSTSAAAAAAGTADASAAAGTSSASTTMPAAVPGVDAQHRSEEGYPTSHGGGAGSLAEEVAAHVLSTLKASGLLAKPALARRGTRLAKGKSAPPPPPRRGGSMSGMSSCRAECIASAQEGQVVDGAQQMPSPPSSERHNQRPPAAAAPPPPQRPKLPPLPPMPGSGQDAANELEA